MTSVCTPRRIFAPALVAVLAAGGVGTVRAADEVNVVRAIEVEATGDQTRIRIEGTHEPTFTVFKLEEPPRLVVDLSRTDVTGVDRLLEVNEGNVKAVITTSFEDGAARMGRVMVVLEQDARYDVRGVGDAVVVSVARPADAPAAVAAAPAEAEAPAAPVRTEPAAEPEPATRTVAEAAPVPAAAPEPATAARQAPAAEPAPAAAEPRRQAAERLPDGVVARHVDRLDAPGRSGDRVLSVRAREVRGAAEIVVLTDGDAREIEILELVNPPRLAVDLHGLTEAPRAADTRGLGVAVPVSGVRIGQHADKIRIVVDGRGQRMAAYEMRRTDRGLALQVGEPGARPAQTAAAPRPAPRAQPRAAEAPRSAEAAVRVRGVTYTRVEDTGRVMVGLDDARNVRYELDRPDNRTAVLVLEGAELPDELERTFDASRFGGEVRTVTAFAEPGRTDRVKVVASLSRSVNTKVVPVPGGLAWEFDLTEAPVGDGYASVGIFADGDVEAADEDVPVITMAGISTEGAVHVSSSGERQQRRRYTGRRITLELRDVDIHNVLRLIAEVSRQNLVVADDVSGRVTLRLRNVPWDQALDLILRAKGLDQEREGNIIRIAPAERLAAERQARLQAMREREELEPLRVRLIPVNFATASDMSSKIQDVLSERGSVTVDQRTNSLIVKDIVDALGRAEQLVRRLDTETPQVLIESRIVEANVNFTRDIGVQWGGNVSFSPVTGNPTGLLFPNIVQFGGAATDGQTPTAGTAANPNFAVNMPAPIGTGVGGGLGFVFGSAGGAANLNLRLSAMEQEGVIKTISSPRIQTLDNTQATISQGLSIPFTAVSAAGANTTFVQAQLELAVTPHVTADGSILMDVQVTNNQPNPQLTGAGGQPSISQKEARTNVMVRDGETMVIGGIYTRSNSEAIHSVPGLGRIPVLGWLFKKRIVTDERTELLVFITPRIVNRQEGLGGPL